MTPRPQSLAEVAERSDDLHRFGLEFQDWLHTVRTIRSRPALRLAIAAEPPLLRKRFPEGQIADAWLAAYAEQIATVAGIEVPAWSHASQRSLTEPWFGVKSPAERQIAHRDSPAAFRSRNLFTPKVDLPLRLRAGRPPKSPAEKRRTNADRQRRFRARRGLELELLRSALAQVS